MPKEGILYEDLKRDASKSGDDSGLYHWPYTDCHQKIKGNTHCNVRYFAKKYCKIGSKDPLLVASMLDYHYPKLSDYFKPDLRKVFDIAYREQK